MDVKRLKQIEKQIKNIKNQILKINNLRPGSLSKQYSVCGTKNCKCKDKINPQKHGPYYQLAFRRNGKHTTKFISKIFVNDIKKELNNCEKLRNLINEWITLGQEYSDISIDIKKQASV